MYVGVALLFGVHTGDKHLQAAGFCQANGDEINKKCNTIWRLKHHTVKSHIKIVVY